MSTKPAKKQKSFFTLGISLFSVFEGYVIAFSARVSNSAFNTEIYKSSVAGLKEFNR